MVTAHKSKEDKQDIPASISVADGLTMQDFGMDELDTLTGFIPNVSVNKSQTHAGQIVFRGIGGMTNMNKIFNINVDGVTIPYTAIDTFLDVERVEILRGSQSSLYGRNTHAGVVNVITVKPTSEFTLDAGVDYKSYNTQKIKTAFGGPVGDNQAYRVALGYNHTDGYMENDFLGTDDGSRYEKISGRAIYDYTPSNDSLIRFSIFGDGYDGGFDEFFLLSQGIGTSTMNNEEGKAKAHLVSPTLTWETKVNSFDLTSTTNYSSSNSQTVFDLDYTMMDMMIFNYDEDFNTLTQEFRLADGASGAFKWLAGAFFMLEEFESMTDMGFGNDAATVGYILGMHMIGDGSIDSQGVALFGQAAYTFFEKFELRMRLRLDYEHRELTWQGRTEMSGSSIAPAQDYTRDDDWLGVMPAVSISYAPAENQKIYASIDRGYKVGDYAANQVDINAVVEPVDPEYTMTYEIGYNALLADRRLEFSCAVFYIDWTNMQVSVVKGNVALMQNAAEAHTYGAEFEARWRPVRGLDLFSCLGLLEGEFDRYDNHPDSVDLSGNALPNAHEYNFSVGAIYRHDRGFFASVSANFLGPKFLDELNEVEQDSYTLVNAKAGYEADHWSLYLYGRNLLDEEYLVYTHTDAGRIGETAVVGAQFSYLF
ncbi:ligand-gated channel [Desulfosarcina ovata subsp. sediminis]|uniref:Ligand-gated channel n=1 Tax=Desulfosarcina ovata subsp. sediminis TaxID=885957 RepID=A0A5K7ZYU3_9BACT|nr:TonB-dependent receptor [Desulfosarcina ovata]BBO85439.1 ligand-gated channel [Desulfosarcina ovata subsp. sediminis]